MSKTSEKVLSYITQHIKDHAYPPTIREIQLEVGLRSSSTAYGHIQRLERDGFITTSPSSPRTIQLVERTDNPSGVKVLAIENRIPIVIEWKGRRYVFDSMG